MKEADGKETEEKEENKSGAAPRSPRERISTRELSAGPCAMENLG